MRFEAWIIGFCAVFFAVVTPIYWFMSEDPTGTSALVMTTLLASLMTFYFAVVAKQIDARPEDRSEGEIVEGAGEQGFFPPYSWWPLFCGLALSAVVMGLVIGWWLFIIGGIVGAVTVCGFVFEYYRGVHAH